MDAVQRFMIALSHQPVDRPPVIGAVTAVTPELMDLCGSHYPDAHFSAESMVELAAAAWYHTGLESMKLPFDMTVEAGALGCQVDPGTMTSLPQVRHASRQIGDPFLVDRSFLDTPRVRVVLEAISLARHRYGQVIPVISSIVGPFSLATMIYGMQTIMELALDDPEQLKNILDRLTDLSILYAREQAAAGSHAILVGEAACSGDLISPDTYRDCIASAHNRLCQSVPAPTILHICGNLTRSLPVLATVSMTGLSFDACVDLAAAGVAMKGRISLIGNVDPIRVLLNGTPEDVQQATNAALAGGIDIVSAGCIWPAGMPLANARAMIETVRAAGIRQAGEPAGTGI